MLNRSLFCFMTSGLVGALLWIQAPVAAEILPDGFLDQRVEVIPGTAPADFEFLPDGRILFAVQRTPQIRLWREGYGGAALVDTVAGVSHPGPESGLVGLAIDPDYPNSPYIYVHLTGTDAQVHVRRYRVTGALSDPEGLIGLTEPYEVLQTPDNNADHNGGTLEFGLDDMLYVSLGDDEVQCSSQDSTVLTGVICRLDVSGLPAGAGGPPPRADLVPPDNPFVGLGGDVELVFCFGLRNPFRFCVHPQTGKLLIGEVGFFSYEEINQASGGENFGWPYREGPNIREPSECMEPGGSGSQTYDEYEYTYPTNNSGAVVGGVVYQQQGGVFDFPAEYEGVYFFSDYVQAHLRVLEPSGGGWALMDSVSGQPSAEDWAQLPMFVSDWELGPDGALYYMLQYAGMYLYGSGELHRIVYPHGEVAVPDEPLSPGLHLWPNPLRAGARLRGELREPAAEVLIYDLRGAEVRRVATENAGTRFVWDGRDAQGRAVAPGLYWARPGGGSAAPAFKITVLP